MHVINFIFSTVPHDVWHFIVNLLSQNGPELQQYGEVSLYGTLGISIILLLTMLYFRPRRGLEWSLFGREVGLVLVILTLFFSRFFHYFSRPLLVVGYTFLFGAGLLVLAFIVKEHTVDDDYLDPVCTKECTDGKCDWFPVRE